MALLYTGLSNYYQLFWNHKNTEKKSNELWIPRVHGRLKWKENNEDFLSFLCNLVTFVFKVLNSIFPGFI